MKTIAKTEKEYKEPKGLGEVETVHEIKKGTTILLARNYEIVYGFNNKGYTDKGEYTSYQYRNEYKKNIAITKN